MPEISDKSGVVDGCSSAGQDPIEEHVRVILNHLGLNPEEEGLLGTPRRVAAYLREFNQHFNPEKLLKDGFANPDMAHSSMVVQTGIPFRMACEHHLLPAFGVGHIGYLPNKRVVGLSKLARLVQAAGTERPSLQEAVGDRIASVMNEFIEPKGVIVVLEAEHSCMTCRGIATPGVITITSAVRGLFLQVPHVKQEFFDLIRHYKRG